MVQVNLIGKKRKERSQRNWVVVLVSVVFGMFSFYFLGSASYVMIRLYQINVEIKRVDDEAVQLSQQISSNKESLSRYVLTKYILEKVTSLQSSRFRYKDYLDQISRFLPAGAILTNVDFATKDWVTAAISLPNLNALKEIEMNLVNTNQLAQSEFATVISESVSSDKGGLYSLKLHFEIKKNVGK